MPLLIRNKYLQRTIARVEMSGAVELNPSEVAQVMEWLAQSPIGHHVIVQFGQLPAVRGDHVSHSMLQNQLALIEARTVNASVQDVSLHPASRKRRIELHNSVSDVNDSRNTGQGSKQ